MWQVAPCSRDISDVKLSDVFSFCPELTFCLRVHLPLAAETVEIIDERPAHECL